MTADELRPVLEQVYEEWVGHPYGRKRMPLKDHAQMASLPGWWTSGWRGIGEQMEPLDPGVVAYFERLHR